MIIAIVVSSVRLKLFQFKLECMRFLHNCADTHVPPGVAVRPLKASSSAANAAIPTALSLERTGLEKCSSTGTFCSLSASISLSIVLDATPPAKRKLFVEAVSSPMLHFEIEHASLAAFSVSNSIAFFTSFASVRAMQS